MRKFILDEDEIYPVYSLRDGDNATQNDILVSMTDEEYEEYEAVCLIYERWQEKLQKMMETH